ncbi:hypothetical protein D9M70_166190 [compost metagenome]
MQAPAGGLADRGGDAGRLQSIQGCLEALVVAQRGAAADEAQDLVGRRAHQPRGRNARIARFDDLAGRPDQDVGIPDRGDAVLQRALHTHRHAAGAEIDRDGAPRLGQREERMRHQALGVARRHVARQGAEKIQLLALCR